MFHFQYRPVNREDKTWEMRPSRPYGSMARARAAGLSWAAAMDRESCPVEIRVVELVSDGRGGMIVREDK